MVWARIGCVYSSLLLFSSSHMFCTLPLSLFSNLARYKDVKATESASAASRRLSVELQAARKTRTHLVFELSTDAVVVLSGICSTCASNGES
jgi:hypothetical protein